MPIDDFESSEDEPKKGIPGAGRYIAIAAAAAIVAVVVVIAVAVSGSNNKTDNAADGTSKNPPSTSTTTNSPSTASTGTSSSPQSGTSAPGTGDSSIPMPSASVSAPPPPTETTAPPSAGDVSGQPALPPISGAEVVITSVTPVPGTHSIDVSAAVNGVTTLDGTCTATAAMGGDSATASVQALFDGRGMSCGLISVPMQDKPAGKWKVTVAFTASGGTAKSAAATVEVK